mmetsp:Transcript_56897/g.128357  ORF Transcript_56897/g.128357 Transcript_56897/m.128357 type:complete len:117 (-) Transcript_56897:25-375(-)
MNYMSSQMTSMFIEADSDGSGKITKDEFFMYMQNEGVKAHFLELDLDGSSLSKLFDWLDYNNTGELDISILVQKCIELRGTAKKVDISVIEELSRECLRRLQNLTAAPSLRGPSEC